MKNFRNYLRYSLLILLPLNAILIAVSLFLQLSHIYFPYRSIVYTLGFVFLALLFLLSPVWFFYTLLESSRKT